MKSPFPGMDPYLEEIWQDVHHKLCTYSCDDIQAQLPEEMVARIDERLIVESSSTRDRSVSPDVRIVQKERIPVYTQEAADTSVAVMEPSVAVMEPQIFKDIFNDDDVHEGFVQIIDRRGGKVITIIEFLPKTNKLPGPSRKKYVRKQKELKEGGVTLVEVDLLRSGRPVSSIGRDRIEESGTPYHICVRLGWEPIYHFYPVRLQDRLPKIAIPLRKTDAPVTLDFQSLIDRVYKNGAYDRDIDYKETPEPPFTFHDAAWADSLLHAAGKR